MTSSNSSHSTTGTGGAKGANDRVRIGVIGVANRGNQVINGFQVHPDQEVVAISDVRKSHLEKTNKRLGGKIDTYTDFRKMLDRKDIDAVIVATPDHWHAINTIDACEAGKDVYCEKPVSATILEGRKMVEAARKNKRVVTVGLHRRSSEHYAEIAQMVQEGEIGQVTAMRCYHRSNMYPAGIGHAPVTEPPADIDWDMWLGPRPERPYQATIEPYKFRWWKLYCSQIANNGVHFIDLCRWITGDEAPSQICALGGKFAVDDDRTIPDTLHANYVLPSGRLLTVGVYEANGNRTLPRAGYFEIRGTKGTLYADDSFYEIIPERGGQFQSREPRMEAQTVKAKGSNHSITAQHARNFLDCIKSRELPNCDIEVGHRSTTFSNLANISLETREMLDWDPKTEKFTNSEKANSLLHYTYRKPWKLG